MAVSNQLDGSPGWPTRPPTIARTPGTSGDGEERVAHRHRVDRPMWHQGGGDVTAAT
ncbi:hypothetical protein [Streptomyces sp. NPDC055005]